MNLFEVVKGAGLYAKLLLGVTTPQELLQDTAEQLNSIAKKLNPLAAEQSTTQHSQEAEVKHVAYVLDSADYEALQRVRANKGITDSPNKVTVHLDQMSDSQSTVCHAASVKESTDLPNNPSEEGEGDHSRKSEGRVTSKSKGRKGNSPNKKRRPNDYLLRASYNPPISFGPSIPTYVPKVVSFEIIG